MALGFLLSAWGMHPWQMSDEDEAGKAEGTHGAIEVSCALETWGNQPVVVGECDTVCQPHTVSLQVPLCQPQDALAEVNPGTPAPQCERVGVVGGGGAPRPA